MVLLHLVCDDLVLRVNDSLQAFGIIVVERDGLLFGVLHLHLLLNVVLHGLPSHIHLDGRAEDIDATKAIAGYIPDHILEQYSLAAS